MSIRTVDPDAIFLHVTFLDGRIEVVNWAETLREHIFHRFSFWTLAFSVHLIPEIFGTTLTSAQELQRLPEEGVDFNDLSNEEMATSWDFNKSEFHRW